MYFFGCIIIVVIVGFPIYYLWLSHEAKVTNTLHNIPEKKISEVIGGEIVRIRGKIKYFDKPMIAPLSGSECVYYHVTLEEKSNDRHSTEGGIKLWSTILDEEFAESVVIHNGKDYAYIDTTIVNSYLVMDKEWNSGYNRNATQRMEKFLESYKEKSTDYFDRNRELRYREGVLQKDEIISVAGKATWKNKNDFNFDIPVERILVISAHGSEPVYLSNEPFATGTG
ncbi:hypothetical protein CNR22_17990 [Sphingobacteriaceae bacterium]|nr:hypothetical protein CNR22_17990 [Sphingobacteriaceae bacterium]